MSGDGTVFVSFHGMEQAAADMEQALARLRGAIEALNTNVGSSLAEWDGSTRSAYQAAQSKWDSAVNRMHDILGNAISTLQNITNDHKLTEQYNTLHWENLTA